jgi:putative NADH-flavin reductase
MANILVIGASRGTGALAVRAALDKGHSVSAFARSPETLALEDARLKRVKGDVFDAASVAQAVQETDAVIVTVSVSKLSEFKIGRAHV